MAIKANKQLKPKLKMDPYELSSLLATHLPLSVPSVTHFGLSVVGHVFPEAAPLSASHASHELEPLQTGVFPEQLVESLH